MISMKLLSPSDFFRSAQRIVFDRHDGVSAEIEGAGGR
jgi:hypothetical protein